MVGASGAIGGVMGAYALLYPRAHVHMLIFLGFYVTTVAVPAIVHARLLVPAAAAERHCRRSGGEGGVAFWAHIGGFVAGLLLSLVLAGPRSLAAYRSAQRRDLHSRYRWF